MNFHAALFQKISILILAFFDNVCSVKDNSSLNLLSASSIGNFDANTNQFSDWANYYKKTEAKLDNVLAKCYECIEKRNNLNTESKNFKIFIIFSKTIFFIT
jgi:hypothetical protein